VGESVLDLRVEPLGAGTFRLVGADGAWRFRVDRDGTRRYVTGEGVGEAVLEAEGRGRRRRREAPEGTLSSPMPGTVVKVLVAQGDTVKKGQDLVVVEAMKMEIKLSAPRDGTVKSLRAEAGARCDAGEALVELEADGSAG
jgi:pyruvate carboxylase subunit B